jgi:hypothetical protein
VKPAFCGNAKGGLFYFKEKFMKRLSQPLDANQYPVYGLGMPDHRDALVLEANTAKDYTIPTGAKTLYIVCVGTANIWVNPDDTAVIPAADITDGTAPIANPMMIGVSGLTSLSIIADAACKLSIWAYA